MAERKAVVHLDFMSKAGLASHGILQSSEVRPGYPDNKGGRNLAGTSGSKDCDQQLQPSPGCWLLMASLEDQHWGQPCLRSFLMTWIGTRVHSLKVWGFGKSMPSAGGQGCFAEGLQQARKRVDKNLRESNYS